MNKNITLVIVDNQNPQLARLSIEQSIQAVDFKEIITFSNVPLIEGATWIPIRDNISLTDYNEIILKQLWPYIKTDHLLITQWDGMAVNKSLWTDDFLNFDYIGAQWPWCPSGFDVGNGGFSLRSVKLLEACRDTGIVLENENEDSVICSKYRDYLYKNYNIKFATTDVANRFSVEHGVNKNSFGFHGIWNMPYFLNTCDLEIVMNSLSPKLLSNSPNISKLLISLNETGNTELINFLKNKINETFK